MFEHLLTERKHLDCLLWEKSHWFQEGMHANLLLDSENKVDSLSFSPPIIAQLLGRLLQCDTFRGGYGTHYRMLHVGD